MNLDSDMKAVVDQLKKFNAPPIESLSYGNATKKQKKKGRSRVAFAFLFT